MSMRLCAVLRRTSGHELRLSLCLSLSSGPPRPPVRPVGPSKPSWTLTSNVEAPRVDDNVAYIASRGRYYGDGRKRSQHELKEDIDRMFADRNTCDEVLFASFIKDGLQECSTSNVARFARLSGRKSRSKSNTLLKTHLPEIALRIRAL